MGSVNHSYTKKLLNKAIGQFSALYRSLFLRRSERLNGESANDANSDPSIFSQEILPIIFTLKTVEGIHLTNFKKADRDAIVKYFGEHEIAKTTVNIPQPYTYKDADQFIEHMQKVVREKGTPVAFALRNDAQELIGSVGFHKFSVKDRQAQIGYWLAPDYWGRGIMKEVIGLMLPYAKYTWGLNKITAEVFPSNKRSVRVLLHNGFVFDQEIMVSRDSEKIRALLYSYST